jgi:hypothetical protein
MRETRQFANRKSLRLYLLKPIFCSALIFLIISLANFFSSSSVRKLKIDGEFTFLSAEKYDKYCFKANCKIGVIQSEAQA